MPANRYILEIYSTSSRCEVHLSHTPTTEFYVTHVQHKNVMTYWRLCVSMLRWLKNTQTETRVPTGSEWAELQPASTNSVQQTVISCTMLIMCTHCTVPDDFYVYLQNETMPKWNNEAVDFCFYHPFIYICFLYICTLKKQRRFLVMSPSFL